MGQAVTQPASVQCMQLCFCMSHLDMPFSSSVSKNRMTVQVSVSRAGWLW